MICVQCVSASEYYTASSRSENGLFLGKKIEQIRNSFAQLPINGSILRLQVSTALQIGTIPQLGITRGDAHNSRKQHGKGDRSVTVSLGPVGSTPHPLMSTDAERRLNSPVFVVRVRSTLRGWKRVRITTIAPDHLCLQTRAHPWFKMTTPCASLPRKRGQMVQIL